MNKYLSFIGILVFILFPNLVFGADGNGTLEFLKGDGAIEQWFLKAFANVEFEAQSHISSAAALGRAIGGFGALIYMGYLGWEMQEGQRPWSVTPMIKPVIIGLILANWPSFTYLIKAPFDVLAKPSISMFNEIEDQANLLRKKRYELQQKAIDKAMEIQAENEKKKAEANAQATEKKDFIDRVIDGVSDSVSEKWDNLTTQIEKWTLKTQASLQTLLAELIEAIALIILRVCVYGVFGFQKIWSIMLMILGPIAVGISLIPGFDGALQSWIAKFININLFTFISFQAMSVGNLLITSGYKMEIERYETILKGSEDQITAAVGMFTEGSGFINVITFTVVSYIVTGVLVSMTPIIADSIVSAGGAGVANAAKNGLSSMREGAKSAGRLATTGASKGAELTGKAGRTIAGMGQRIGNLTKQKGGTTPKW
ncbi:hypothetical protein N4T42_02300 [Riemerella anatipestifer]|uniref:cell envelope integrity protein TolA n=1 Tax=Riemerella anatipestifer TaxID=34085 RepID=UPI0021D5FF73|nr:hypothetical protein [Riemerella anatipestifer]MCU7559134.1 hypothetical protein [Riemerella anatipestifer]MDY3400706.1 hypothetical protein [Riemerella anatipestifer]